jgi:hypothetical protein
LATDRASLFRAIFHGQGVISAGRRRMLLGTLCDDRAERCQRRPLAVCVSLVGLMYLIDILIAGSLYARLYWYVSHRRISAPISAIFRALWGTLRRPLTPPRHYLWPLFLFYIIYDGVKCIPGWFGHLCRVFIPLYFLQAELASGRSSAPCISALLWEVEQGVICFFPPTICYFLVDLMSLIDILIVDYEFEGLH